MLFVVIEVLVLVIMCTEQCGAAEKQKPCSNRNGINVERYAEDTNR
jgi:hypothetical protein